MWEESWAVRANCDFWKIGEPPCGLVTLHFFILSSLSIFFPLSDSHIFSPKPKLWSLICRRPSLPVLHKQTMVVPLCLSYWLVSERTGGVAAVELGDADENGNVHKRFSDNNSIVQRHLNVKVVPLAPIFHALQFDINTPNFITVCQNPFRHWWYYVLLFRAFQNSNWRTETTLGP